MKTLQLLIVILLTGTLTSCCTEEVIQPEYTYEMLNAQITLQDNVYSVEFDIRSNVALEVRYQIPYIKELKHAEVSNNKSNGDTYHYKFELNAEVVGVAGPYYLYVLYRGRSVGYETLFFE